MCRRSLEHHHSDCRSITGGYVYQGTKFPELRGAYLYGDYQYGKIWGLRYDYSGEEGHVAQGARVESTVKISSFGVGRDGSFYALDYDGRHIYVNLESASGRDDARRFRAS